MKHILRSLIAVALLALGVSYTSAQATLTPTTLSSAVAVGDQTILVASASSIAANYVIVVDGEAMSVGSRYVSGTTIPVTRGAFGTVASAHATSSPVYAGPGNYFAQTAPQPGPCTATNEVALPRFSISQTGGIPGVSMYNCVGPTSSTQTWQLYSAGGFGGFASGILSGRASTAPTYTGSGAIAIQPGLVYINGSTLAMTLANPSVAQNGMIMIIESTNASAHTVTYTAGFNGGTTARDVATFGGAVGDNLVIIANNGVWWVISTRNVSLG